MNQTYAYKILRACEFAAFDKDGQFTGSPVDIQDGYIHLSLAGQLQGTLDKHYTDGDMLSLVEVELAACGDDVKFEVSRGGARFPHLYNTLYKSAIRRIWPLKAGANGQYKVPLELEDR